MKKIVFVLLAGLLATGALAQIRNSSGLLVTPQLSGNANDVLKGDGTVGPGGGGAAWGGITGMLSDQTDLETALAGKAGSSHSHVDGDIPNTITIDLAATASALAANPADCGANAYATTIAANGNLTCAQVAYGQLSGTPADLSGEPIVTTAASGSLSNEKVLPTCAGTDKLTFNGTAISCATDQTGGAGGVAFREFFVCPPGNSAAGLCHTFTNLVAAFVEVSNNASRNHLDLADFTDFRILAVLSVAAVAGDIRIDCDADAAFGSPATLGTLDNPTNAFIVGAWTTIPANECKTAGGQYMRAGMVNGNTTEDPTVRSIRLQVK